MPCDTSSMNESGFDRTDYDAGRLAREIQSWMEVERHLSGCEVESEVVQEGPLVILRYKSAQRVIEFEFPVVSPGQSWIDNQWVRVQELVPSTAWRTPGSERFAVEPTSKVPSIESDRRWGELFRQAAIDAAVSIGAGDIADDLRHDPSLRTGPSDPEGVSGLPPVIADCRRLDSIRAGTANMVVELVHEMMLSESTP